MKKNVGASRTQRKTKGQAMMEYMILVALLAVASIPVVKILGDVFRDRVVHSANAMIGDKARVDNNSKEMVESGAKKIRRSLDNFHHSR